MTTTELKMTTTELKNELKRLENKHKELLKYRRFVRRNCDIIVLESRKLEQSGYNDLLLSLTNKIKLSNQSIKVLKEKICPQRSSRTNLVLLELDNILKDL